MGLTELSKQVDELFVDWSTARRTPGAAVRVICNGRVIHSGHYGLADIDKNIAIDPLTSFRLASLTKQFTAVAIMMLVERKLLGYDDPLSKFLTEFKGDVGRITIRQLLWHTSGLPEYEDIFRDTGVIDKDYPRPEPSKTSLKEPTSKETRQLLAQQPPPKLEPGEECRYSNSGYVLLAQIVEAVTKMTFPEFVKKSIFEKENFQPPRMLDSVIPAEKWRDVANRAKSYSYKGGQLGNIDYTPLNSIYGDDGIYTTIEDMVRWDHALQSGILVQPETLDEAFKPGKLNNGSLTVTGFGWFIGPDFVYHAGKWVGFRTYIRRYRSRPFTIIVLANCMELDAAEMGERIAEIYRDGREEAIPPGGVLTRPPDGKLYHGVYPGKFNGVGDDITPEDLDAYTKAVGKKVAIVYFSNEWGEGGAPFPLEQATWITNRKAVPFIRLMLRTVPENVTKEKPEQIYTLDNILKGAFDEKLRVWGESARDFQKPLLVEYGTECNGSWMPWNVVHNGKDGTKKFRSAFRHIVRLMTPATNIRWVFHVNGDDQIEKEYDLDKKYNRLEDYYPGDDVVDWLAVSCYGAQSPTLDEKDPPKAFAPQMDAVYKRFQNLAPSKPVYVAEFGCVDGNPKFDHCLWTKQALHAIFDWDRKKGEPRRWEKLIGFSWWNSGWDNGKDKLPSIMLVQKIDKLPEVFKTGLDPYQLQVDPVIRFS